MKKLLLFLIVCAGGFGASAQLDGVVAEFYGNGLGGDVYRVYAEMSGPNDFVSAVYAASGNTLTMGSDVGTVLNHMNGSTLGDQLQIGFCGFIADICNDSYLTLGFAGTNAGTLYHYDDSTPFASGSYSNVVAVATSPSASVMNDSFGNSNSSNLDMEDGSWFAPNAPGSNTQGLGFGANNRVFIAQVAIPAGAELQFCINLSVFPDAIGANEVKYLWNADNVLNPTDVDGSLMGLKWPIPSTGVDGCMDSTACNYDSAATIDDGSCILPDGCTDSTACNYDSTAQCDDGSCSVDDACGVCGGSGTTPGCTDSTACNFDSAADCDDGSCTVNDACGVCGGSGTTPGCTDASACNFDSAADCDDASCCFDNCVTITVGGGDFDSEISWELVEASGGSSVASGAAPFSGDFCLVDDCYTMIMTDAWGDGWNGATWSVDETGGGANYGSGTLDDGFSGSAGLGVPDGCGCTDSSACNYDSTAVIDDGSCTFGSANDLCADATPIAAGTIVADNTAACLNEGAAGSCHFNGDAEQSSIWYLLSVGAASDVTIETSSDGSGSFNDTQLAAFDGCGGSQIGCSDDDGSGLFSLITLDCFSGDVWIQLDGFDGEAGTVNLTVTVDACAVGGGCTDSTACNYDSTATTDDGSCSFDNDGADCPTAIVPGGLGSAVCIAGDLTGATASSESQVFAANGADRWYSFVAESPGVAISLTTADFDAMIELHSTPGSLVEGEDVVFVNGSEVMNYGSLTEGDTYYISARSWGTIGTGLYDLCVETLPDTRCDYGSGPYGVCATFKADWVGCDDYLFNFTSQTTSSNYSYQSGFANTFVQLGDIDGLEYGDSYDVAINSIYNRVDGNGSADVVIVDNNEPCVVNVDPHPAAAPKASYNCSANGPMFLGQYLPCVPWICGNTDWEWEFTRTDVSELPITHLRGSNNRYLRLSDVAGLVGGGTYDVRVRPVFAAASSTYGATVEICIVGSGGAPQENIPFVTEDLEERDVVETSASVAIYPNPVTQGNFNLNLSGVQSEIITLDILDLTGKTVQAEQITVSNGSVNTVVELADVASGVYMVRMVIDGKLQTERLVVEK
jgi:hypothetical protein